MMVKAKLSIRGFALLAALGLCFCGARPCRAAERERFLIVNSYHEGFEWSDSIMRGMKAALDEAFDRPALHFEYLDTKRHFDGLDGPYLALVEKTFAVKYHGIHFDALLCSDDVAYRFLVDRGGRLFGDVPIVFAGVNEFDPALIAPGRGVTGVVEITAYAPTIDFGLVLRPGAKRLGIVTDSSLNGVLNRGKFKALAAAYAGRLEFVFLDQGAEDLEALVSRVKAFDPDGLIYFSDYYLDGGGRSYEYDVSVPAVVDASPCPVLYHSDMYLGFGVLGGIMNRSFEHGELAGRMAADIARGRDASSIPVVDYSIARPVAGWAAMRKFGIPESRVPKGTAIWGKPPGFLERNWRGLLVAGSVIGVLAAIIAILFRALARAELSEARFKAVVSALPVPIFVSGPSGAELINEAFTRSYGYSLGDFSEPLPWWDRVFPDPEYRRRCLEKWTGIRAEAARAEGRSFGPHEIEVAASDGSCHIVDLYFVGLGERGVFVWVDVTERMESTRRTERSLREKEILLQEVHHRVKNNLQIVSSLLRLQTSYSDNEEVAIALGESTERLIAMSLVHEQVYLSESLADIDFADYAADLVDAVRGNSGLDSGSLACEISGSGIRFGLDSAVPLGLALNELLTNSVKHARVAGKPLAIAIALEESEDGVSLSYRDNGPGLPRGMDTGKAGGLGLSLVRALAAQLEARVDFYRGDRAEDAAGGFRMTMRFRRKA